MQKKHESLDKVTKRNGYHRWLYSVIKTEAKSTPKRLLCGMYSFTIFTCETVPQFNDNLTHLFPVHPFSTPLKTSENLKVF